MTALAALGELLLLTGLAVAMLSKLWLLDRMVWVHRETLGTEPPPRQHSVEQCLRFAKLAG
ncbi:hypothetical protein [Pleomorphomonas sp. T1.2MG-36]|uniref:hypothetical protein n=1 Tax=Pleomorphomonas sp. T1.2MG-36 TaxID=3041167 RepID=UPI00254251A3|nr:hypothetical protein [Pleomorphomonas sp. T1.2MG-36]